MRFDWQPPLLRWLQGWKWKRAPRACRGRAGMIDRLRGDWAGWRGGRRSQNLLWRCWGAVGRAAQVVGAELDAWHLSRRLPRNAACLVADQQRGRVVSSQVGRPYCRLYSP